MIRLVEIGPGHFRVAGDAETPTHIQSLAGGPPRRHYPNAKVLNHGARGLGDSLLALCAVLGYVDAHPEKHVIYGAPEGNWPFLRLFEGCPDLTQHVSDRCKDAAPSADTQINLGYSQENRTRCAVSRLDRYCRNLGGVTPRLPTLRDRQQLYDQGAEYRGCVVLAPCISDPAWRSREYPKHSWVTIEARLRAAGYRVLVVDNVAARLDLFPFDTERAIGWEPARLAALLLNAGCLVGQDSGPAHFAGILGVPTIVLSGVTRASQIYNFYPRVSCLAGGLDCDGCHWGHPFREALCQTGCASIAAVPPDRVIAEVDRLCRPVQTLTSGEDIAKLLELAHGAERVLEIGCFAGGTAKRLASVAGLVVTVDDYSGEHDAGYPYPGYHLFGEELFREAVANLQSELKAGKVTILRFDSLRQRAELRAALDRYTGFDVAFIDGNHGYEHVRSDVQLALEVVRPGGVICGHDYQLPGVRRAVAELLGDVETLRPDPQDARASLWWTLNPQSAIR